MALVGADIEKAKWLLEQGKLVAIPTETVYGLAGNAFNPEAVTRIFSTKNRPSFDPLIVHVHSVEAITNFAYDIPEKAVELTRNFWPGPLTILLKRKSIIPDLVTSGLETVAVRMPRHELTRSLLSVLPFPLAAPSANPFGYVSPTTAQHVNQQLGDKIEYILDGGACTVGVESTIISFESETPTVLRLGGITVEDIEDCIGRVFVTAHSSSRPQAPGMLKSHYSPTKIMVSSEQFNLQPPSGFSGFGYIGYSKYDNRFEKENQLLLSENEDLAEAAKNLFASLRALDQIPHIHTIVIGSVPDVGLGRAINDRLRRAIAK